MLPRNWFSGGGIVVPMPPLTKYRAQVVPSYWSLAPTLLFLAAARWHSIPLYMISVSKGSSWSAGKATSAVKAVTSETSQTAAVSHLCFR